MPRRTIARASLKRAGNSRRSIVVNISQPLSLYFNNPRLTSSCATCTAFVAAPLRKIVCDDPEIERVRVARIFPNSADKGVILPGSVYRLRKLAFQFIHQDYSGSMSQRCLGFFHADRSVKLDVDRLGMTDHNRYAHAGRRDADRFIAHDLAGLVDDLVLLLGVAVGVERPVERNDIPGQLAAMGSRLGDGIAFGKRTSLRPEILQSRGTFTR